MAEVEAFSIEGLKAWFWSHDHEPPHFHVKKAGEWEVRVYFLLDPSEMIELRWAKKKAPAKKVLKEIATLAEEHRIPLLEQWEAIHEE